MAQVRKNHFQDVNGVQGDAMPVDVGHKMVKSGKAAHPHWRSGAKGNKQAKRMYSNADAAHGHTKVGPRGY